MGNRNNSNKSSIYRHRAIPGYEVPSNQRSNITRHTHHTHHNARSDSNLNTLKCPICSSQFNSRNMSQFRLHYENCKRLKAEGHRRQLNQLLSELRESNDAVNTQVLLSLLSDQSTEKSKHIIPTTNKDPSSFEYKFEQFRNEMQILKIDWRRGAETIEVERDDWVNQSLKQFYKINPWKELKIAFKGEISNDAGGWIREWWNEIFKQLLNTNESSKYNWFTRADTDDVSYIINTNNEWNSKIFNWYLFIGKVLGKALLENWTVNWCFNKWVYKIILEEEIELGDLIFIDKPWYHSLKELKGMTNIEELSIYFVLNEEKSGSNGAKSIVQEELISNGSNILVTNNNIDWYISKRIEHLVSTQKVFLTEIKHGIEEIVNIKYLKIFNSDELALVLNGIPFIDIEDWKLNTQYKGYTPNEKVIVDFWGIWGEMPQEQLSKLLQFCTGSSRVPIGGFKMLESNRGNVSQFCITKVEFYDNKSNFWRAHTCFNRLDLPCFPNKNSLENGIKFVIENSIVGFGID